MEVDESFRDLVTGRVAPLLKGVVPNTIRREDCCPTADCVSPGGLPIVDAPAEGPNGLVVAAGFHGRGVMCSPVTGWTVHSLVTGEPTPFPIEAFGLDRFEDRSADFEYRSHWD
jgi:glycine/D-amino acid oxidase-like deaminating enzyme